MLAQLTQAHWLSNVPNTWMLALLPIASKRIRGGLPPPAMLQLPWSFPLETFFPHLLINLGAHTTDMTQCAQKGLEPMQVLQKLRLMDSG